MDAAREYTDREIRRVARDLAVEYGRLGDEQAGRVLDFLTERAVDGVVPESALQGRDWARLRSEVARQMSDRNRASAEAIGGRMGAVRGLTAEGADPSSKVPCPAIDRRRDLTWNERHVEAAARAAVGKDPSVAAKGVRGLADMNRNAAVRKARTAINGAENAGRMDAMLARGGSKRWVAVMDERTRVSHASINGEVVPVSEPFSNGLMYPGDPSGPPEEVYNCRCTMEWVAGDGSAQVVNGENILDTWERRPDQFDFEIDDVIDAQGFNGLPKVVDADEFDQAVRQANGGDGLVMQRVYSAPDQATLDAYRESLYDGKWYVDCSHGNDTYGKGMYTASSKSTSVTQQMEDEVSPYRREFSYTETMTLDPSAKVIGYNEVVAAKNDASVLERAIVGGENISDTERAIVRREVLREYDDADLALVNEAEKEWDFDDYMAVIKKYSQREREFRELGTSEVAVLLGYDAVEVPGLNYTVVLNRTKLIIRRPK